MRKLTDEEIKKLTNKQGLDKSTVETFLRNMPLESLDAMDDLVKNARYAKWEKQTILACLNGLWLSTGLPQQEDIAEC